MFALQAYCERCSSRSRISDLKAPQPRGSGGVKWFGRLPFVVREGSVCLSCAPFPAACSIFVSTLVCFTFREKALLVYIWYHERAILTQAWVFLKWRISLKIIQISLVNHHTLMIILYTCKYIKLILSLCPSRQWSETSKGKNTPSHPWKLYFSFVSPCFVFFLFFFCLSVV